MAQARANPPPGQPKAEDPSDFFDRTHPIIHALKIEVSEKYSDIVKGLAKTVKISRTIESVADGKKTETQDSVDYNQKDTNKVLVHHGEFSKDVEGNACDLVKTQVFNYLEKNHGPMIELLKLAVPKNTEFQNFFQDFMNEAKAVELYPVKLEVESGNTNLWYILDATKCVKCQDLQVSYQGQVPTFGLDNQTLKMIEERLSETVRDCTIVSNEVIPKKVITLAEGGTKNFKVKAEGKTLQFTWRSKPETGAKPSSSAAGSSSKK